MKNYYQEIITNYYGFEDFLVKDNNGTIVNDPLEDMPKNILFINYKYYFNKDDEEEFKALFQNYDYIDELLRNHIINKCWKKSYFFSIDTNDGDVEEMDLKEYIKRFFRNLITFLSDTCFKYSQILEVYTTALTNEKGLLADITNKVKSDSQTATMPVNTPIENNGYIDGVQGSTIIQESNKDTIIKRIAEISSKIENTYKLWASEFIRNCCIIV